MRTEHWRISKLLFFGLLASIIVIITVVVAGEIAARTYIYLQYGQPGKSYGLWRYDDTLGAQHQENAYNTQTQTNNFGFRVNATPEDVFDPKPDGAWRLITYGGSTTFCYNLSDAETWPAQLETILRQQHHSKDQVLNGGAILWSLGHAFARANKDIPILKPDYVIIYAGINETANAGFLQAAGQPMEQLVRAGEFGRFATNMDQNRWVKRNIALVRLYDYVVAPFLKERAQQAATASPQIKSAPPGAVAPDPSPPVKSAVPDEVEPDPFILANYRHVLQDFIRLIQENGGTPIYVIQTHGRNNEVAVRETSYSRAGRSTAQAMGAVVIDGDQIVRDYQGKPMDLFYETGVHLSAEGARRFADLIYHSALEERRY